MKFRLLFFLAVLAFATEGVAQRYPSPRPKVTAKSASSGKRSVSAPHIKFEHEKIEFGNIKEDQIVEKCFEFTNSGSQDLLILGADASCGCTVPSYPKHPIPPGGKGTLTVKYTAKNKVGPQKPMITVVTNGSPSTSKVFLEGWVEQIPGGGGQ